jgi:uncharacterized surface protein with fasciclin (FAS1) repeats
MSLTRRAIILAAATGAAALGLSSFAPPLFAKGTPPKVPPASNPTAESKAKDLIDTLAASTEPTFKSLLEALKGTDLTTMLKGTGPFTLFAPTDDAFKKLPDGKLAEWMKPENKETLKGILSDHVVASKMLAADLAKAKTLKTAGGHTLDLRIGDDMSWVGIQGAHVTKTDVLAGNGIIHFMDAVILPSGTSGAAPASPGSVPAPAYSEAELAKIKSLAEETLKELDAGATSGMGAKLTDLETAWDEQEATLKPKDSATWTLLDKTLDRALSALRGSKTNLPKGRTALQDLIKGLEQAAKPRKGA